MPWYGPTISTASSRPAAPGPPRSHADRGISSIANEDGLDGGGDEPALSEATRVVLDRVGRALGGASGDRFRQRVDQRLVLNIRPGDEHVYRS